MAPTSGAAGLPLLQFGLQPCLCESVPSCVCGGNGGGTSFLVSVG